MSDQQLTTIEQADLERLERRIEAGIKMFAAVGAALSEIRERRLYRQTHENFESYCQDRFGFSRQRAAQLIGAAEVVENLSTTGLQPPGNERQARPLAGLAEEAQKAAWAKAQEAATRGQPTAAEVEAVVPKSLRGLSAEEQLAAIQEDQERIDEEHEEYERRRIKEADDKRMEAARHHLRNALRHVCQVTDRDTRKTERAIKKAILELDVADGGDRAA